MKAYIKLLSLVFVLVFSLTGVGAFGASAESTYTQPEKFIYGDVDLDGVVTVRDATLIQKGVAEIEYLTAVQRYLADLDSKGVSVRDATAIQKYLAGIEKTSSVDEVIEMKYVDKFSSETQLEGLYYTHVICVEPKSTEDEYTLEDFPEYDFNSIKMYILIDWDNFEQYKVYHLCFESSGDDSLMEAIKALDYRANIDLKSVEIIEYYYADMC